MEATDYQIKSIDFGNSMLNYWIKDESGFMLTMVTHPAILFCMVDVFGTLTQIGELPVYGQMPPDLLDEVKVYSEKWYCGLDNKVFVKITKCVAALYSLSNTRLQTAKK